MDEGISAYTVRGEGLSRNVEDLTTNFILAGNDKSYVSADKYMTHGERLRSAVAFLRLGGGVT